MALVDEGQLLQSALDKISRSRPATFQGGPSWRHASPCSSCMCCPRSVHRPGTKPWRWRCPIWRVAWSAWQYIAWTGPGVRSSESAACGQRRRLSRRTCCLMRQKWAGLFSRSISVGYATQWNSWRTKRSGMRLQLLQCTNWWIHLWSRAVQQLLYELEVQCNTQIQLLHYHITNVDWIDIGWTALWEVVTISFSKKCTKITSFAKRKGQEDTSFQYWPGLISAAARVVTA